MTRSICSRLIRISLLLLCLSLAPISLACDPCALFNATDLQQHKAGSFSLSLTNQLTHFEELSSDYEDAAVISEYNTTLLSARYDINESLGFQTMVPLISINSKKSDQSGNSELDAGLGDIVFVATQSIIDEVSPDSLLSVDLSAGFELPTGDSSALKNFRLQSPKHHTAAVSGGRALTYGSGSLDFLLGGNAIYRKDRFLVLNYIQYAIRQSGSYGYRYNNDLIFQVVPSYYLVANDEIALAAGASFAGEYKGKDSISGNDISGSAISNIYVGPNVMLTSKSGWGGQLAVDKRTTSADVGQIAPDWRSRISLAYRF